MVLSAPDVRLAAALCAVLVLPLWSAGAMALDYQDVTGAAGIEFRTAGELHDDDDGSATWPAFAEILGGGACWGDLDGDGWPDLYLVNHRFNEENPSVGAWADLLDPRDILYLNNGDGTFRDATDVAGIDGRDRGYSCALADADGDGDLDLFVGNFGRDRFWVNDGEAHFTDRTNESGIGADALCAGHPCVTMGAAWADYDRDGDVDLYVTNYVRTNYTDTWRGPVNHVGQVNRLYENDGQGVFAEVAATAGVQGNPTDAEGSKSFQAVWEDFDVDGDLDLYVTNDMVPNDYYENAGDGTFVERSNETGLADPRAGMGLTTGDFDGDCLPDLFFTHYSRQDNGLYRNRGDGTFEDLSGSSGHHNESWFRVGWGTHFVDVDLDGDLDILTTNGHTEWTIEETGGESTYAQHLELFRNDPGPGGTRDWVPIHDDSGPSFVPRWVGRGLAVADHDLDGDPDFVVVPNANQTASLHRGSGAPGHWLRVELASDGANTMGVGALVKLTADGHTQCRRVLAGSGYLGQNELALTFGVGTATAIDSLEVQWPSGITTQHVDLAVDQALRVHESGLALNDTLSPRTALVADAPGSGWWPAPVSIWFETEDLGVTVPSGVVSQEYRVDDGPWMPYDGASFTFTDEGITSFALRARDAAGNREPVRTFTVGRDFGPPSVTATVTGTPGANGWYVSPSVRVEITAEDTASGVDHIRARVDDGAWARYTRPLVFAGAGGIHTVEFEAVDRAGHVSTTETVTVFHDPVAPNVTFLAPRPHTLYLQNEPAPFPIPGDDAVVLGIRAACDSVDGHPLLAANATTFPVTVRAEDTTSGVVWQALRLDGALVAEGADGRLAYDWDVDQGLPARHVWNATASDAAGNAATVEQGTWRAGVGCLGPTETTSPGGSDVDDAGSALGSLAPGAALVGLAGLWRRRRV